MSGLNGMRIESLEIEFASEEKDHRAHGLDTRVVPSLPFGRLKQPVEGFEEAIGLPRLRPRHDPIEVLTDHSGYVLHRNSLGSHHVRAPLLEHGRHHMDLFAGQDLTPLFPVQPGPGGAFRCEARHQGVQVRTLGGRQLASILEQGPAQPLQRRIGLPLGPAHLVHRRRGVSEDVNLVERDASLGQGIGDPLNEGGRHCDVGRRDLASIAPMSGHVLGERRDGRGIPPFRDEEHLALLGIGDHGQIGMPTLASCLVNGNRTHLGQVSSIHSQVDIVGAKGLSSMPGFAHDARHGRERHLASQQKHQRLEQQREARQVAGPGRLDQGASPIRQPDARHADFQIALMLEDVQMPIPLTLGIMDRVHPFPAGIGEPTAHNKINMNNQGHLDSIEINALNKPRVGNAQGGCKDMRVPRSSPDQMERKHLTSAA